MFCAVINIKYSSACHMIWKSHLKFSFSCSNNTVNYRHISKLKLSECKIIDFVSADCQKPDGSSSEKIPTCFENIYKEGLPVIIKGLINNWPAISDKERRWEDFSRLRSRVDGVIVPIEYGGDYMSPKTQFKHVDFSSLIEYLESDLQQKKSHNHIIKDQSNTQDTLQGDIKRQSTHIYLAQHNLYEIPSILEDVNTPKICETGKGHLYKVNIWLGGVDGVKSPCHYDPFSNILCQVFGTKHVILFHPDQSENLYPALGTIQKNTSLVDFSNPDLVKHPLFEKAIGYEANLNPGDGLFIPYKWWHYCQTNSLSCSVNFWWI